MYLKLLDICCEITAECDGPGCDSDEIDLKVGSLVGWSTYVSELLLGLLSEDVEDTEIERFSESFSESGLVEI